MSTLNSILPKEYISDDYDLLSTQFTFEDNEKEHIFNLELNKRPPIKLYGKLINQKRDIQFFSDDVKYYTYSKVKSMSKLLTPQLKSILSRINKQFNEEYNGILINRYNDGTEYISKHKDNENELGNNGIISLSIGATRKFRIRNKDNKIILDYPLKDGDIIWMKNKFNNYFTHEIPVEKKVKECRISLTFRKHKV